MTKPTDNIDPSGGGLGGATPPLMLGERSDLQAEGGTPTTHAAKPQRMPAATGTALRAGGARK